MNFENVYTRLCEFAGRFKSLRSIQTPPDDLWDNLESTGMDIEPEEVVALATLTITVGGSLMVIISFAVLVFSLPLYLTLLVCPLPVLSYLIIGWYPKWKSEKGESRALESFPRLLGYLTVVLKVNPNLERAAIFSANRSNSSDDSFRNEIWKVTLGRHTNMERALTEFARRWKEEKFFKRSLDLIRSSVSEKSDAVRSEILDRAMTTVFEGIRDRMKTFVAGLQLPTMMMYGIGVLLPLILLAVLPVISSSGFRVGGFELGLFYCGLIPMALHFLKGQVLSDRPAGFNSLDISTDEDKSRSVYFSGLIGLTPSALAFALGLSHSISVFLTLWGLVSAVSFYCYLSSEKAVRIREFNSELEDEFCDALTQIGNQLKSRLPPETVFIRTAKRMESGEISKILEKTSTNLTTRGMTIEEALYDPQVGSLRKVHSKEIRRTFRMITNLLDQSSYVAGEAALQISNHLENMAKIKDQMRQSLSNIVNSMKSVVFFFAPFIASITVQIQDLVSEKTRELPYFGAGVNISTPVFLAILGLYIVILTVILLSYTVEIEHGNDWVMKKTAIARTLPVSMTVFSFGLVIGKQVLMIIVG